MKNVVTAAALGLALTAGQVAAQDAVSAQPRVNDRLGQSTGEASEFASTGIGGLIVGLGFVAGFALMAEAQEDDSESD